MPWSSFSMLDGPVFYDFTFPGFPFILIIKNLKWQNNYKLEDDENETK